MEWKSYQKSGLFQYKNGLEFIETRLNEIERHLRIVSRLFQDNLTLNSKDIKIIQSK